MKFIFAEKFLQDDVTEMWYMYMICMKVRVGNITLIFHYSSLLGFYLECACTCQFRIFTASCPIRPICWKELTGLKRKYYSENNINPVLKNKNNWLETIRPLIICEPCKCLIHSYTHICIFIKPGRLECSARLKCKVNNMNGNYISIQPKYEVYKIKMLEICLISI